MRDMEGQAENAEGAVVITTSGMSSALGRDVVTACAAFRAGLTCLSEHEFIRFRSPDDGEEEGVMYHPARDVTDGFEGRARLLRLLHSGLSDLQRQNPNGPWQSTRTGFFLSVPDSRRLATGLNRVVDDDTRRERFERFEELASEQPDETFATEILLIAAQLCSWPGTPDLRFVATSGHTGVAEALARAVDELRRGKIGVAVVGGVDSLVDEDTIAWLQHTGRLKVTGVPVGLRPGEACGLIVLETLGAAVARGANILAKLHDVQIAWESTTLLSGVAPSGQSLAEVLIRLHARAIANDEGPAWIISDHNGENYRAMEWGNAVVRTAAVVPSLRAAVVWYPAASFGDTGAASGAISLCTLAQAFRRGYAPARVGIVVSSSDGEMRTAIRASSF